MRRALAAIVLAVALAGCAESYTMEEEDQQSRQDCNDNGGTFVWHSDDGTWTCSYPAPTPTTNGVY